MDEFSIECKLELELTEEQMNKLLGRKPGKLMLVSVVPGYEKEDNKFPDALRVTFEDESVAEYYLHIEQPKPVFVKSRNRQGYVNKPLRRRARK